MRVTSTGASRLFLLPPGLRFAASAFAVVFLLVFPNSLNVAIAPQPDFNAALIHSFRLANLARSQPLKQSKLVNPGHFRNLRRREMFHLHRQYMCIYLTRQG